MRQSTDNIAAHPRLNAGGALVFFRDPDRHTAPHCRGFFLSGNHPLYPQSSGGKHGQPAVS